MGVHTNVCKEQSSTVDVYDLQLPDEHGKITNASNLVWPDMPHWVRRCRPERVQWRFWSVHSSRDWREIASSLVWCAGLRKLSDVVDEKLPDVAMHERDGCSCAFRDKAEQFVKSDEFPTPNNSFMISNPSALRKRILLSRLCNTAGGNALDSASVQEPAHAEVMGGTAHWTRAVLLRV